MFLHRSMYVLVHGMHPYAWHALHKDAEYLGFQLGHPFSVSLPGRSACLQR